eukprot:jgi/Mesvir1/11873/Mv00219-RA.1
MLEEDFEREIKVLVVGNGGVGKTSMIRRFAKGVFTNEYKKTIGVDFLEKSVYMESLGEEVKLMLWDTAGQEEFDTMTRQYYRGAGAAVLAFSTTDRASFDAIPSWKAKVEAECGPIAMALVQNKVDLIDQTVITSEEAEAMANTVGLRFYRACVKENLNVSKVFEYLAEASIKNFSNGPAPSAVQPPPPVSTARIGSISKAPGTPTVSVGAPPGPQAVGTVSSPSSARGRRDGDTLNLTRPSRMRTSGKKKLMDRMACTIL